MRKEKNYKCFTRNNILVQCLWILAIVPLFPAILGGSLGTFSFWEIFACCCISLAVAIATIITMVLTKYKIDSNGITINASRKTKKLVLWNEITCVEISCVRRYDMNFIEFKSDDSTIMFNTSRRIINRIIEFSKDCDKFNRIFSESLCKAQNMGTSENAIDKEQLPDAQETKIFLTDTEHKTLGGTGFHEIQYCVKDLPIKKLLHWKNIDHWLSDSLYIEAQTAADKFFNEYYDKIFGAFGRLDYFGINYFNKEQTQKILCELQNQDLPDKNILIDWLEVCVNNYNGFYFLGV